MAVGQEISTPGVELRGILTGSRPALDPSSDAPLDLTFAKGTSLRQILETLAELAGVNILFDESFQDQAVAIDLSNVSFQEALDILVSANRLFYSVIRSSSVMVSS